MEEPSASGKDDNEIKEPLIEKHTEQYGHDPDTSVQHGYNHGSRPCRDVVFAALFVIATMAAFGFGIFAIVHHNNEFRWTESPHYFRNESRCSVVRTGYLKEYSSSWLSTAVKNDPFTVTLIVTLAITLCLSIPIVIGLIVLLRIYAKKVVYLSLPLFVLFPVALNILWFVACAKDEDCTESLSLSVRLIFFIFIFGFCGIIVWIIFANFQRIELTIRVIRTAAEALYRNLSLLLVVPSLSVLLLVFVVPVLVFIVFSYMNGKYIQNPELDKNPDLPCGRGTGRECCVWHVQKWVPAYITLAALYIIWTACVIAQMKVYTISGTISQWYFAEVHTRTIGALGKSLGQAFSSSFGTLCLAGLVFGFVRLVRNLVDSAKNSQGGEGLALSLARCCYEWLLRAIEFLTKFTVDYAAITGEGFCASARGIYDLLKRNLLSTVFVEVISTRILGGVVFVVSIIYAIVVWGVLKGAINLDNSIYTVTVLSWALLFLILSIFLAIMNIVIDTVYICYAIDKDKGVVSKPEAHDVYVLLPVSQEDRTSLAVRNKREHSPV